MGTNQRRLSPMFGQCRRRVIQADCSELISLAQPQAGKAGAALLATTSSTGWSSVGEVLMILRTSAVAVCCSWASLSSRVSRATSVSWPAGEELRWRTAFRAFALRLRALASLLLAVERRRIAHPRLRTTQVSRICGRRNGVQYKFAERSLSAFGPGCSPIPGARWLYRRWMLRCLYNPARVNSVFGRREAAVAYHFWQERSAEVRRTAPRACCVCRRQQEPLLQRAYAVAVIYRY
jgi:hypothetical protein